ncbi:MAG TPA: nucleotidyltransferase domain-containing protein [Leptospiraceae bacterium]|nr:nucleotidyltransferase domain-containing protein [Leptospiraceae bacterium]HMW06650.1 nucleotidyltransferase domain-containing protein [Leptospiraceae bacterium]HMX35121.1 nucleotidyltransferase domain-containing protein [Leptospiraceae bacterium]HMY33701.1 nucleotidyltransferase domain-containing protein [Leptospiraceae bacterium]HMZ64905.1 nucleotidyltransferase domain-containing protein [Leptospiraceae bacterium]
MIQLPNPSYETAIPIFQKFNDLQAVYLFGSVATGQTNAESDVDFGFVADKNIKDELSLELIKAGFGNFSLVYIPEATPVLQFEIVDKNFILYQKPDFDTSSFRSKIIKVYLDMEYYKGIQRQYLKERILNGK